MNRFIIIANILLVFFSLEKLRVRDLEGALEVEKSEVKEVKCNLDTLTKQHRLVTTIANHKMKFSRSFAL